MSEMEYTEALEFLIKHFPNELVEAVCEGFPTEVMDYIGDKYETIFNGHANRFHHGNIYFLFHGSD